MREGRRKPVLYSTLFHVVVEKAANNYSAYVPDLPGSRLNIPISAYQLQRGRRTFPLKVSPYSVVYRKLENSIRILIVRHQHRKPDYAGGRM
jgi:mRNA-degrading endonuclease RelE of RelBE toxin-antitoxin system